MKTQRLNLEAKFQKQTSYLKGNWNATWRCYGEFSSSSPELYLSACKAIKIVTMASLPNTGKMLWTATLEILSWLLAHLVPVLVFLFLLVRNFLDASSEIKFKINFMGWSYISCCWAALDIYLPLPISELSESLPEKKNPLNGDINLP